MNFFKAYILGLKTALTYPRMLLTTYLLNFFLSAVFFIATATVFTKVASRSIEFTPLLKGFDLSVISDYLNNYGQPFNSLVGLVLGLGIFNWLLNIFLSGGIVSSLKMEKFTMRDFFGASGYNFFSFLLLDLLAWSIFIVLFVLLGKGVRLIFDQVGADSEVLRFQLSAGVVAVFAFFAIMSIATITYAKAMLVLDNSVNFLTKFFRAWVFTYTRFYVTIPLVLLLIAGPVVVSYLYFKLEAMFQSGTMAGIMIGFLIQQAFILLRVFFRIWILSSHYEFYDRQYYRKRQLRKQQAKEAAA